MKTAITVFCFLLTLTADGQLNDADAFFNGNYNKTYIRTHNVREASVVTYINGSKSSFSKFSFTRNGLLTKETTFDRNGKKINDYLFTYNQHGDQIERKNVSNDLNKIYIASFTKIYRGKYLTQQTSNESPYLTRHFYDKKGKKLKSSYSMTSDTGECTKQVSLYSYDAKGRLKGIEEAKIENKTSKPGHIERTTFIYDKAGNIIDVIREGKAKYTLKYDRTGLLKTKVTNMPGEFDNLSKVDKYSYVFWN